MRTKTYRHSKRYLRLAARRDDILAKNGPLSAEDIDELDSIKSKIAALPETSNYNRYILKKVRGIMKI